MAEAVIRALGLGKRFGATEAVRSVSFEVARGSICGLLGGNGAGKTTTIAMLLGLLIPTTGKAVLLGADMQHQRYRVLPRLNFSSPYVDLPQRLTVRENLTVYARLYGVRARRERIAVLAGELALDEFLDRPYRSLSAGQKTRVALAKALLNEPELLLLDEPTASMDPDTADRLRRYLAEYARRSGASILLASHNMQEVERICDDAVILRQGTVVAQAAPAELIRRYGGRDLEQVFLDIARRQERLAG